MDTSKSFLKCVCKFLKISPPEENDDETVVTVNHNEQRPLQVSDVISSQCVSRAHEVFGQKTCSVRIGMYGETLYYDCAFVTF